MARPFLSTLLGVALCVAAPQHSAADDALVRGLIGAGTAIILQQMQQQQQQPQRHQVQPRTAPRQPAAQPYRPRQSAEDAQRRADRMEIQRRLNALGFDAGPPDGVFGPRTRRAIAQFQLSIGAAPDGRISPAQIAILYERSQGGVAGSGFAGTAGNQPSAFMPQGQQYTAPSAAGGLPALGGAPDQGTAAAGGFPALGNVPTQGTAAAGGFPALGNVPYQGTAAGGFPALGSPSGAGAGSFPALASPAPSGGSGTLPIENRGGFLFVGGRLAARGGEHCGDLETQPPLPANFGMALFRLVAPQLKGRPLDEAAVLSLLPRFDEATQKAIFEEVFQKPYEGISDGHRLLMLMSTAGSGTLPFARQRALEAIRARADQLFNQEGLAQPVPIRVYCTVAFEPYDFSSGAFEIASNRLLQRPPAWLPIDPPLGLGFMSTTQRLDGVAGLQWIFQDLPAPPEGLPESLPMSAAEAEAFAAAQDGRALLSYETEATLSMRETEAGPIATVAFAPPRNFILHRELSLTNVLAVLGGQAVAAAPGAAAPEKAGSGNRRWNLREAEDVAALVGLAGPPRELPADGRTLSPEGGDSLGVITLQSSTIYRNDGSAVTASHLYAVNRSQAGLATALAVPREHLIDLSGGGSVEVYGLLPGPADAYTFTAPADMYGRPSLASEVELAITAAHLFTLPEGKNALVLAIDPVEGRFLTKWDGDVLERFPFNVPADPLAYDIIEVPSRVALLKAAAERFGLDAKALVRNNLDRSLASDPFALQDLTDSLLASAPEIDPVGSGFWVYGALRLKQYDFETSSFPVSEVSFQPIGVLRKNDVTARALDLYLPEEDVLAVAMPPEEARTFVESLSGELLLRARVRTTSGDTTTYGNLRASVDVLEAEILAADSILTIRDPKQILYRYPFSAESEAAEGALAQRLSRKEAEARLDALLQSVDSNIVLIRRTGSTAITTVFTSDVQSNDYVTKVRELALEMPESLQYTYPPVVAHAFRKDRDAAIVARKNFLAAQTSPNLPESDGRKQMITLFAEFDLTIEAFPPVPALPAEENSRFSELWPDDAEYAVLRRRDDAGTVARAVVERMHQPDYLARLNASIGVRFLNEFGDTFTWELPLNTEVADLGKLPDLLRNGSGLAVVVSRQGYERILPRLDDLDLVVRRFPPEEIALDGFGRDTAEPPQAFAVLGVTVDTDQAEAEKAAAAEFAPEEIATDETGALRGSRGICEDGRWHEAASPDEVGSLCLKVSFAEGKAAHVALRQVVEGDASEAALQAFRERYPRDWLKEVRYLEKGAVRSVYGWGTLLDAGRAALGRVDAKTPPSALEAVIWVAQGLTTIQLHLDTVPVVAEVEEAKTPDIKF